MNNQLSVPECSSTRRYNTRSSCLPTELDKPLSQVKQVKVKNQRVRKNLTEATKRQIPKRQKNADPGNQEVIILSSDSESENVKPLEEKAKVLNTRTSLEFATRKMKIMLNLESSKCQFCSIDLPVGRGVMLQHCFHAFCRHCLEQAIITSTTAQIKCPADDSCEGYLYESEVKVLVKPDEYQKYLDRSLRLAMKDNENIFYCKTKSCNGYCEFEADSRFFLCEICNMKNCLQCQAIHDALDCTEYQNLLEESGENADKLAELMKKASVDDGWTQLSGAASGWLSQRKSASQHDSKKLLQEMENSDLWKTTREFECSICYVDCQPGGGVILQECMHFFCKECLIGVVEYADEPEIKCPHRIDNEICQKFLKPREIKALVSPELYEKYLTRSIEIAESVMTNTFHCITPDCFAFCELLDPNVDSFTCLLCQRNNCIKCKAIHENISCEDYKNRLVQTENDIESNKAVEEMIRVGTVMRCPTCKIIVEKITGCDWLQCRICRTEICWATKGPRWGPKGKGDTSAGCGCLARTGGRPCTPACGNCH